MATQNLDLTRQKFDAGVSDNVEVVQSQEALSTANTDYINSVFAHNLAKLSLARAIGRASEAIAAVLEAAMIIFGICIAEFSKWYWILSRKSSTFLEG